MMERRTATGKKNYSIDGKINSLTRFACLASFPCNFNTQDVNSGRSPRFRRSRFLPQSQPFRPGGSLMARPAPPPLTHGGSSTPWSDISVFRTGPCPSGTVPWPWRCGDPIIWWLSETTGLDCLHMQFQRAPRPKFFPECFRTRIDRRRIGPFSSCRGLICVSGKPGKQKAKQFICLAWGSWWSWGPSRYGRNYGKNRGHL